MAEKESIKKAQSKTIVTPPDKTPSEHERMDKILDKALDETFPASDPIELTPIKNEK